MMLFNISNLINAVGLIFVWSSSINHSIIVVFWFAKIIYSFKDVINRSESRVHSTTSFNVSKPSLDIKLYWWDAIII